MTKIHLDFGGFYDSIHSDQIERKIELENSENENFNYDSVDYKRTFEDYAKDYLTKLTEFIKSEFENNLDLKLEFVELDSPRFYNYENDTIIVQTSNLKSLYRLSAQLLSDPTFIELIKKTSTEREGYLPFYTYLQAIANKDDIFFRLALQYCCNLFNENGDLPIDFDIFYKS